MQSCGYFDIHVTVADVPVRHIVRNGDVGLLMPEDETSSPSEDPTNARAMAVAIACAMRAQDNTLSVIDAEPESGDSFP